MTGGKNPVKMIAEKLDLGTGEELLAEWGKGRGLDQTELDGHLAHYRDSLTKERPYIPWFAVDPLKNLCRSPAFKAALAADDAADESETGNDTGNDTNQSARKKKQKFVKQRHRRQ